MADEKKEAAPTAAPKEGLRLAQRGHAQDTYEERTDAEAADKREPSRSEEKETSPPEGYIAPDTLE